MHQCLHSACNMTNSRVCCRVEQSADSMGAAQIEIQAKKFFHGFLEKSFKIQSCQKPNKN